MNHMLQKFRTAGIVEQLISLNILFFLLTYVINTLGYLFNTNGNLMIEWFSMPANLSQFTQRPWSLLSYGFLHGGFLHILSNMLILHYIGRLFVSYLGPKKLLHFYLYGTVFGGVLFAFSYHFFPVFKNWNDNLVGASSGIMAIFVGIATHMPNYELRIRFIGGVKLWILAAIFVGIDLIQIPTGNAGGHLAHIGGALFGYFYIKQGTGRIKIDRPSFLHRLFSKKNLKTVHRSPFRKTTPDDSRNSNQKQIDAILDKISKSGYDSLNQEEKDFLFRQGKK